MTGATFAAVTQLLARARRAGRFPGACAVWCGAPRCEDPAVVCHGDAVVGHGAAAPVRPDTLWDLASLTKPLVVTTLALLARRDGNWRFDAPLETVLPEARGSGAGERSLASLLAHTAGLPAWRPVYALAAGRADRAMDAVLGVPLGGAQGERTEYSCLGFLLLGWALERTAGMTLDELFRRRVAQPLGLGPELGFLPRSLDAGSVAGGASSPTVERELTVEWGGDPAAVPAPDPWGPDDGNARFLGGVAGNAGLFGTGRAAVRLAAEYLPGGGTLLTADEVASVTRWAAPDAAGQHRTLGWQLASSPGSSAGPALDPRSYGHTGYSGVSVWVDPARGVVMGLFAHRHHPAHRGVDLHPVRRRFHAVVSGGSDVGMPTRQRGRG